MYRYAIHTFRPSETIEAVLRLKGRHDLTKEQLRHLMVAFEELNGKVVPRVGMTFKIPLPVETVDRYGNVVFLPEHMPCSPEAESEGGLID